MRWLVMLLYIFGSVNCYKNVTFDHNIQPIISLLSGEWLPQAAVKNLLSIATMLVDWLLPTPPVPEVDHHAWWGEPHHESYQDTSIRPYRVKFNHERINRLLQKLNQRENFTSPLHKAQFNYGTNTIFLKKILDFWQNHYDFKAREDQINEYPQFITNVQGLDIHFYHIKPKSPHRRKIPLLMLHGWPATNMEYIHLFPHLLNEREGFDHVFEIVAPTIPGFGYSQGTSKVGLNTYQIAIIFKNLMNRLGYKKFYIHGGDFGQVIAADMMTLYQDEILGLHTNFPYSFRPKTFVKYAIGSLNPSAVVKAKYAERLYPIFRVVYYILRNFGVALKDSPSGLASWILTVMSWSSNPNFDGYFDGGLNKTFEINDLLHVLTIMWDSESITTSIRLYAEYSAWFQNPKQAIILINPTKVPYSCIKFRYEIIYQPDNFIRDKYPNLVHSKTLDFGGHFAAFANPQVLTEDIWVGVHKMIKFNEKKKIYGELGL